MFVLDIVEGFFFKDGFLVFDDLLVGEGIVEMEKRGFLYFMDYGLDFCEEFVFDEVKRYSYFILWQLFNKFQCI